MRERGLVKETLTLHRPGLFKALGTSLKMTNYLESLLARVEQRTAKVDRWQSSAQEQRWLAAALFASSPGCGKTASVRCLCS